MMRHAVTLDSGATYKVARGVNIRTVKPGEKVQVTYTGAGPAVEASAIAPAKD